MKNISMKITARRVHMNSKVSQEIQDEALAVAKATQKQGQSKEQTKLIAKGIEKGISEFKKQQKIKVRDRDKQRKQKEKSNLQSQSSLVEQEGVNKAEVSTVKLNKYFPWLLLALSWAGFVLYNFK